MLSAMIEQLEVNAPVNAVTPILEFKEYSLKPLNSYVHGGLHAIDRHSKGYPIKILEQALKASNGLSGMVAMFIAILTGDRRVVNEVLSLYEDLTDCFISKA
jgi:hypothetical protein